MSTVHIPTTDPRAHRTHRFVAVLLALHGVAHLVGTQDALRAAEGATVPYLFGAWHLAGAASYVVAAAWTAAALGFAWAAFATWEERPGWTRTLVVVTAGSLALSLLALPQAVVGVTIDLVLLTLAWGWSPTTPRLPLR